MKIGSKFIQVSINRPKMVTGIMILVTMLLGSLISMVHVDTNPENMLNENEQVRVFHDLTKKEFTLHDMVVLGVVNEKHEDGVFNPKTLQKVHVLTEYAKGLFDPENPEHKVVARDIVALGNLDSIEQAGLGQVRFEWLMKNAPETKEDALRIRDAVMGNPLLKGTLVSEDQKAVGIYIPITSKDFAFKVRKKLLEKIDTLEAGSDKFYITGLPVAEDTFGKEMFIQMAISAPLAMVAIFLLMLLFFRKVKLIIAPMIVAMVTVICTMGMLIGTGNTLHIMSSMIPIFLMPIAVVDSIHILSEFFDQYQKTRDRQKTISHVMDQLFMPMLYTSLTSAAGFASLALTPIPPVQAFGVFVAIGIMLAWIFTIIFIPAYIMLMDEKGFGGFGAAHGEENSKNLLNRMLTLLGASSYKYAKFIIFITFIIFGLSVYGINKIVINDNPVKWFKKDHDIRVADRVLNSHFGGTYEAYIVFEAEPDNTGSGAVAWLQERLQRDLEENAGVLSTVLKQVAEQSSIGKSVDALSQELTKIWQAQMDAVPYENEIDYEAWEKALDALSALENRGQIFKRPDVLGYIENLQNHLQELGQIGKSNSVVDLIKKVHQELFEGKKDHFTIPDTVNGVAQTLISFQNSHKPEDLWHMVTPDYTKTNIFIQLRSGDNTDMQKVVDQVSDYLGKNKPPVALKHSWAGLTYINVVWQDKMVSGMRDSFFGSFVIVFLMMTLLFRSPSWGILAMVPLTFTIAFIYGVIGFIGKDYDMPVAVLSSLTLGLAVDFAIHFLERCRMTYKKLGSWKETVAEMFEEPARAITRNAIVIAIGFTPLLAAPLVPYQTVGIFLATIMFCSGLATMLILPAILTSMKSWYFSEK